MRKGFAPLPAKVLVVLILLIIGLMIAIMILNIGKGEGVSFLDSIEDMTEGLIGTIGA